MATTLPSSARPVQTQLPPLYTQVMSAAAPVPSAAPLTSLPLPLMVMALPPVTTVTVWPGAGLAGMLMVPSASARTTGEAAMASPEVYWMSDMVFGLPLV